MQENFPTDLRVEQVRVRLRDQVRVRLRGLEPNVAGRCSGKEGTEELKW